MLDLLCIEMRLTYNEWKIVGLSVKWIDWWIHHVREYVRSFHDVDRITNPLWEQIYWTLYNVDLLMDHLERESVGFSSMWIEHDMNLSWYSLMDPLYEGNCQTLLWCESIDGHVLWGKLSNPLTTWIDWWTCSTKKIVGPFYDVDWFDGLTIGRNSLNPLWCGSMDRWLLFSLKSDEPITSEIWRLDETTM